MPTVLRQKVSTCLMFDGQAEEAMNLYVSLFKDSKIVAIQHYGTAGPGKAGKVQKALFSLNGQEFLTFDTPVKHEFGFTPAVSIFVHCDSDQEIDGLYKTLSENGKVIMPLDNHSSVGKFCWIADRYGVSWQMILAPGVT
ncbi:MAG: VOC family protein [Candidatus Obscuribacterales bacterium]|nr:VOC family protein [Candidatus Obscuribacterales bacterium]